MRTCDVAIIGGGVIGASVAFELAAEKLRIVVFDRQEPGREASWAAAGMLSPSPHSPSDLPLVDFAKENLRQYPDFVAAVEEASGKQVGYARDGAIELFLSDEAEAECHARLRELLRHGFAAESISGDSVRGLEPSIGAAVRAALWLSEEATVEPRLLMDALLEAVERRGVEIRANCAVTALLREAGRCTGVIAGSEKIAAKHVVLAAGCFSNGIAQENWARQYAPTRPVRGQMFALRPPAGAHRLRRVVRSKRAYLVPRADGRIVAGSTIEEAGFNKNVTAAGIQRVLNGTVEICPELATAELIETWAGLRPGTPDDLPILGQTDVAGLWMATGHYRNGILLAPATAKLIRDWILGPKTSFDASAFSPMRFSRKAEARTAL